MSSFSSNIYCSLWIVYLILVSMFWFNRAHWTSLWPTNDLRTPATSWPYCSVWMYTCILQWHQTFAAGKERECVLGVRENPKNRPKVLGPGNPKFIRDSSLFYWCLWSQVWYWTKTRKVNPLFCSYWTWRLIVSLVLYYFLFTTVKYLIWVLKYPGGGPNQIPYGGYSM